MNEGIMSALCASAETHRIDPHSPEYRECLTIDSALSEIEFLHCFEACPAWLDRADRTGLSSARGRELLPLWTKLGRLHPVTMRWFLLGLGCEERVPKSVDRKRLTELLDWSWSSFNKIREFARSELERHNASVAEKDANQQALEEVEKITESDRDRGEDLLESEELKRQLREAKERLESGKPPRK